MRLVHLFLICILFISITLEAQDQDLASNYPLHSDQEITDRLEQINNRVVAPRFDGVVRSYVNTYTVKKRDRTEAMLGRTAIYFPLFEKLLAENNMPLDLKFLSVVESALNPMAVSRSGAVGLWQFMPATGKEYGLKINRYLDERKDPEKSTLAAIKYLKRQYNKYGNWELALAAYNGGPGRVNRAIKRGRSKNFWRIKKYLPRETRNYIPAYIAATYIAHFYHMHDLMPIYPDVDLQVTESVKVYQTMNFREIAELTGTPEYIIEILNPSYKRHFLPSNSEGNNLVLPKDVMAVFKAQFKRPDSRHGNNLAGGNITAPRPATKLNVPANAVKTNYTVEMGDHLSGLASAFQCTETDIMIWNRLASRELRKGQELVIYLSKDKKLPVERLDFIDRVSENASSESTRYLTLPPVTLPVKAKKYKSSNKKWLKRDKSYLYHKIKRGESLQNISDQYAVPLKNLLTINNIKVHQSLKPGKRIKIKKK